MASRTRRLIAVGAFAVAAAAGPAFATMTTDTAPGDQLAAPPCLAWFGNKEDGKCLSYSNGNGINVQSPTFNYCSPGVNRQDSDCGVSTGPLVPGTTIDEPIG
ncbi:MAG: DUF7155 family protein [Mycobacterium sp.]